MAILTYTKSGTKSSTPVKIDKTVFGNDVKNHELLKRAYLSYMANSRNSGAHAKTRGMIRGGGAKPHRQKGTGRARSGSNRNPLWTGGGVIFGPTGMENHFIKITTSEKRLALRQALSLAAKENRIKVIDSFNFSEQKTKQAVGLLSKMDAQKRVLIVVNEKDKGLDLSTRNLSEVKVIKASYLNVFDILNADNLVVERGALETVSQWLGEK